MSKIKRILSSTIRNFKKSYSRTGPFELFVRIVLVSLVIPFLAVILNNLILLWGVSTVVSKSIMSFFFSPVGFFFMTLALVLILILTFIEIFGLVFYTVKPKEETTISLFIKHFIETVKKIKLSNLTSLIFYTLSLLFISLIGVGTIPLSNLVIPNYLNTFIFSKSMTAFILIIVFLGTYFFFSIYAFTFHYMIVDNDCLEDALHKSSVLTKKRRLKVIFSVLIFQLLSILMSYLIYLFPKTLSLIFSFFNLTDFNLVSLISVSIFIFQILFYAIFFSLSFPFFVSTLTTLFNRWHTVEDLDTEESQYVLSDIQKLTPTAMSTKIFKQIIVIAIIAFSALTITQSMLKNYTLPLQNEVRVIAMNSGINDAPQNTRSNIENAIILGASAVQIDVRMTKDGALVLSNTSNLSLLNNETNLMIENVQYADLKEMVNVNEPFITFEEALLIANERIELIVNFNPGNYETASMFDMSDREYDMLQKMAYQIANHKMEQSVSIYSVSYEPLRYISLLVPSVQIGLVVDDLNPLQHYARVNFYHVNPDMLDSSIIVTAHLQGLEVFTGPINKSKNMEELVALGVDAMSTVHIEDALRVVSSFRIR